jgi:hypothetical protein
MSTRPLPKDSGHNIIQAGSAVSVANIALSAGEWTEIILPDECKTVAMRLRSNRELKFSTDEGDNYITLFQLELDVVKLGGQRLGWVMSDYDDTLEMLIMS